jgi:hypothetical protein
MPFQSEGCLSNPIALSPVQSESETRCVKYEKGRVPWHLWGSRASMHAAGSRMEWREWICCTFAVRDTQGQHDEICILFLLLLLHRYEQVSVVVMRGHSDSIMALILLNQKCHLLWCVTIGARKRIFLETLPGLRSHTNFRRRHVLSLMKRAHFALAVRLASLNIHEN